MTLLLFVGLLVAILAGRGTVFAQTTGESTLGHETPEGDNDDTESDDLDASNFESSGNGREGEDISQAVKLFNDTNDSYVHCGAGNCQLGIIILVIVVLLIAVAVALVIFLCQRRKKKTVPSEIKEEEALTTCDAGTAPTPMFDDDIPSVLELEMEDLQKLAVNTDMNSEVSNGTPIVP
ncbi:transmembrane protein 154-like [Conger conger]|nr:transmembrane protein 154-like [Conger conger]